MKVVISITEAKDRFFEFKELYSPKIDVAKKIWSLRDVYSLKKLPGQVATPFKQPRVYSVVKGASSLPSAYSTLVQTYETVSDLAKKVNRSLPLINLPVKYLKQIKLGFSVAIGSCRLWTAGRLLSTFPEGDIARWVEENRQSLKDVIGNVDTTKPEIRDRVRRELMEETWKIASDLLINLAKIASMILVAYGSKYADAAKKVGVGIAIGEAFFSVVAIRRPDIELADEEEPTGFLDKLSYAYASIQKKFAIPTKLYQAGSNIFEAYQAISNT